MYGGKNRTSNPLNSHNSLIEGVVEREDQVEFYEENQDIHVCNGFILPKWKKSAIIIAMIMEDFTICKQLEFFRLTSKLINIL